MAMLVCASSIPAYPATLAEQLAAMQPGTWSRIIAANTASDVDPEKVPALNPNHPKSAPYRGNTGYTGLWAAWNGGALAEDIGKCGTVLHYGGGHMDYWASSVIGLDLCGDDGTPKWRRLSDPYFGPITWPIVGGTFPDGSPNPAHTAQTTTYAPDTHELIVLVGQTEPTYPTYAHNAWVLDLDTKQWRGPFAHGGAQSGSAVWDPVRKQVWFQAFINAATDQRALQSFTPATNEVLKFQNGVDAQLTNGGALMGYDPDANVLVNLSMVIPYNQKQIGERNPANPNVNWKRVAVTNWPTILATSGSMAWSKGRRAWIVWMDMTHTADVWELKRALVSGVVTYNWTLLTDAANTINPGAGAVGNGTFNKFGVVQAGNDEVLIGQATLAQGIVAFRLPRGIGPAPAPPASSATDLCESIGAIVCERFSGTIQGQFNKGANGIPRIDNGEMVIDIPVLSAASNGGELRETFAPVKEGETIAFSYRVKVNKDTAEATWPARKEAMLYAGPSACTGQSLSQGHNLSIPTLLMPNTECGAVNFAQPIVGNANDALMQQGNFECHYRALARKDLSNCAVTIAGIWQTYYVEVHVGRYGQPNSHIAMWQRNGDGLWRQYIEAPNFRLASGNGFDTFSLNAYMTGRDATKLYPVGEVRFDDLIITRQPFLEALRR